jgi:hypothetical protein
MVRRRKFYRTATIFGLSLFLSFSLRDFGCGKAKPFDDFFRKDRQAPRASNDEKQVPAVAGLCEAGLAGVPPGSQTLLQ